MSSSSDVVRVTIPIKVQNTIQGIKEIASKHSEEDIYAMLRECNMDPNETAQKLLYLDTFHEVKRKRDRKKPNVAVHAPQQYRWTPGMQRRRGGSRGRNSSIYVSDDTGGSQHICSGRETGSSNHMERSSNHLVPVQLNNASSHATIFLNGSSNGPSSSPNGGWTESNSKLSVDNFPDGNKGKVAVHASISGKRTSFPTVDVEQLQALNPGPDSTPTPTVGSGASFEGRDSGVYSSASDPVLVPSLNPRNPGAVGAINRETGNQKTALDLSGMSLLGSRLDAGQDVVNNSQVDQRTMISSNKTSQGVEENQDSVSSSPSPLLNHVYSFAPVSNQDSWPAQQVNGATKLKTSEGETVLLQANVQSLPKFNDAASEQLTLQLDKKLEKLNLYSHQPVIFPDHIQVTEAFRNGLTFGSLDDILVYSKSDSQEPKEVDRTVMIHEDASREPSLSHQTTSSVAHEGDFPGHPESHAHVPENSPLEVNISSAAPTEPDHSKPELVQPPGALQYPFLHNAPDYSFGFMPPVMGPQFIQVEGAEVGNSSISSTSGSSQPPAQTVGVGQNSITVPTQFYPLFRQPYPSNYFPYNPYFPQFYMPHNATQFLGHGGFPQQASTGNIYLSPPAASAGVKFPVPPMYKPGTFAANLTQFGIPSIYGSYGSSDVSYGHGATMASGSSISNEDLLAPELKEKNVPSTMKQVYYSNSLLLKDLLIFFIMIP